MQKYLKSCKLTVMKFAELKKHFQNDPLKPAYLVTGVDAFLVQSAVGHFKKLISVLPELNISIFSESVDARSVLDACETLPTLSPVKLVLCYDYKGDGVEFLKYLAFPNPQTVLVFISEKLTDSFAKLAAKLEVVDCAKLTDEQIQRWMNVKLLETEANIERSASELLVNCCARDMSRISRETEKLGIYKAGRTISEEDVVNLVAPDAEFKAYELSDAIARKKSEKAIEILKNLLDFGIPPATLSGIVYGQFRRMLYCAVNPQDFDLAKKLGVKEYAVKMALSQARAFSPVRLKKICDDFHRLDFAVKSGEIGDRLGLESYIFKILSEI